MSESGPQEPEVPTVNENVKLFLDDLPREGEGDKKHHVSTLLGKDSCVIMFGFNQDIEAEQAVVIIKVLFDGENKQDLVIESIQVHSKEIKLYFSVDSLKILIEKSKGKFSRVVAKNVPQNQISFWKDDCGFTKVDGENDNFELVLK